MALRMPAVKIILLAVLGIFALVAGSIVLTLQLQVLQETSKRGSLGRQQPKPSDTARNDASKTNENNHGKGSGASSSSPPPPAASSTASNQNNNNNNNNNHQNVRYITSFTNKSSYPTEAFDTRLWNLYPAPEGGNFKTIGEAYWRQVQSFLRDWKDAAVYPVDPSDHQSLATDWMVRRSSEYRSRSNTGSSNGDSDNNNNDVAHYYPRLALERAADAGHSMAQHYLANAHASGIWPVPTTGATEDELSSDDIHRANSLVEHLHVLDEWLPSEGDYLRQIDKAYILWHMAAIGGNIESAMALAYRLDDSISSTDPSSSGGGSDTTCEDVLPYYQAAANGVIDQLEVSENSRAKVIPFMDKHSLAQVHMHGGTSSQLDWNNKPDESKEALQFYHLKATTVPWSIKKKWNSGAADSDKGQKKKSRKKAKSFADQDEGIDVTAAYTLAHMYNYGVRGVEQNLTKSLDYYEIAGSHGHWESAGAACTFYLWGIGTTQNALKAFEFCKIGAPFGWNGCNKMHERAEAAKDKKRSDDSGQIQECDEVALNGMGLLHLLGIRDVLEPDLRVAEKYFTLAKQQGSVDAYYNLAMMWTGWKTHYKSISELKENGFTSTQKDGTSALPIPGQAKEKDSSEKYVLYKAELGENMYYKGPIQSDVQSAMKLLAVASKLGHVQAKHRLGLIYAQGLNHTTSVIQFNFVKKDCKKAKENFQWIIHNASPTRSDRLRRAYKEYVVGNLEVSVRNYLAAAEIGSIVGQVNAAFLMERGVCLGLGAADCAKAAVRLWKVAAARGNAEACLRVGDFYYYGRLHGDKLYTGPFGWVQYILHPEKYLPALLREWSTEVFAAVRNYLRRVENDRLAERPSQSETCSAGEGTCPADNEASADTESRKTGSLNHGMEEDLHTAAHYYQIAGEKHQSARANFNLGFMHQWGLGLKQDFPMAKRYYDLALSRNYNEAEIAVQIALIAMNTHEFAIRCKVLIEEWWYQHEASSKENSNTISSTKTSSAPSLKPNQQGAPKATTANSKQPGDGKTREKVIMSHLFDGSSVIIAILFIVLLVIQVIMTFIGRPQR